MKAIDTNTKAGRDTVSRLKGLGYKAVFSAPGLTILAPAKTRVVWGKTSALGLLK